MSDVELLSAIVPVMLRAMRRKNMFRPSEKTAMHVAATKAIATGALRTAILSALEETLLEKEERRDTPRKPG